MTVFTSVPIHIEPNWPDREKEKEKWDRRFFNYYIPYWKLDFPDQSLISRKFRSSSYIIAKVAWSYWPVSAAIALVVTSYLRRERLSLRRIIAISFLTISTSIASLLIHQPDQYASEANAYHRMFLGVLMLSKRQHEHLRRFHVSEAERCIGVVAYTADGRKCLEMTRPSLGWIALARVLAREPRIVWCIVLTAAENMQVVALDYLGKYSESDPRATAGSRPGAGLATVWSALKGRYFPRGATLIGLLVVYVGIAGFTLQHAGKSPSDGLRRDLALVGLVASVIVVVDMFTAFLGDGANELSKHLFMANVMFDVASIAMVNLAVLSLSEAIRLRFVAFRSKVHAVRADRAGR
jgi:hypothetical protein